MFILIYQLRYINQIDYVYGKLFYWVYCDYVVG